MGSQSIQGELWGQRPADWANIQERTGMPGYEYVLDALTPQRSDTILDVGCGSGIFCDMVQCTGATVTGIDATQSLIDIAIRRNSEVTFLTGEMEELPFENNSFTIVSGFNSFQYASNVGNALRDAYRVLKPGGTIAAMIWGQKEECEAANYLKAAGSMMPPPPPGAPGPFALSENQLLEKTLEQTGFSIKSQADITSVWEYKDADTAMRGLMSAGPVARAIGHSGYEKTYEAILSSISPFTKDDGSVVFRNKFRVVVATKPN